MTTRLVPDDYPDLATALLASEQGDTVVLNTSGIVPLVTLDLSALDGIAIFAGEGRSPVLDHSGLSEDAVGLTIGAGWTLDGLRFRDRNNRSTALECNATLTISNCEFEGCRQAIAGDWSGTVARSSFRHTSGVANTAGVNARIEACALTYCVGVDGAILVNLTDVTSSAESLTLIRCMTGDETTNVGLGIVSAGIVRGVTAQGCKLLSPPAIGDPPSLLYGISICARNNAFECEAGALFGGADVVSNNTEVDPQHVALLTDLRLLPTSPLIGAGVGVTTESDRNGVAFLSSPSIGAHESARLGTVVAAARDVISAGVTGGIPDLTACLDRESWRVTTADGVRVAVRNVVKIEGEDRFAIFVHPDMSPAIDYTLRLSPPGYGWDEATFTAVSSVAAYPWRPYRNIAAVMNGPGDELHDLLGPIDAVLAYDFEPGDVTVFVESTLDWYESGAFWTDDGRRFTYTSKTDGALHGVAPADLVPLLTAYPSGTRITLDLRSLAPEA